MKLYDWMSENLEYDDLIMATDKDYDIEVYFCINDPDFDPDDWDIALEDLSRILDVVKVCEGYVVVNLGELIERSHEKVKGLFRGSTDVASIAESMTSILGGYCSGTWLGKFVNALS